MKHMNFNDIYWHDSYLEEITLGTSLKSDERVFKMKVNCPDSSNVMVVFDGYYSFNLSLNGWIMGKDIIVEADEEKVNVVSFNKEYELTKYTFRTCSGRFEVIANGFQVITEN